MTIEPHIFFSDFFGLAVESLEDFGAFDVSLINDLPVFIDPFLLFNSSDSTYRALHESLIRYMLFLKEVTLEGPLDEGLISAWFAFPEVRQNWLGFSTVGNRGHGLGADFAKALHSNFARVFRDFGQERITHGSHIEKLCLIRSGVGRDNISDFTTNLIKQYLAEYTQTFARKFLTPSQREVFSVGRCWFNYDTQSWVAERYELPKIRDQFVLLTPKSLLTRDHTWISRVDLVNRFDKLSEALPDHALRAQLNRYVHSRLSRLKEPTAKQRRAIVEGAIDANPQVLDHYILDREQDGERASSIAAQRVKQAQQMFVENAREFAANCLAPSGFYELNFNTHEEARHRLLFLKDVIENKGGHRLFYVDKKPIRKEEDIQILYRLTWFATSSVVSREVNDGRGPSDFQVARHPRDKTIVELKLAKNSQLARNLAKQCGVYERASDATHPSIKGIVYFNQEELDRVTGILADLKMTGDANVVLIDARSDNKLSGSRA